VTSSTAFLVLLTTLIILNAIATVALIRQVGLLHLRIRPVPALITEEGPRIGDYMVFDQKPWELNGVAASADRFLLAFVSPTCRLCTSLMVGLRSLASRRSNETETILVTDVHARRAEEYLRSHRADHLPFISDEGSSKRNNVPGTPYVAVIDRTGRVLSAGGVNTLEQIEYLLETANDSLDALSAPSSDVSPTSNRREWDAYVRRSNS
jgi:methylamine dehydrogenase accessory protein MauD